jgi:hypothetical protein
MSSPCSLNSWASTTRSRCFRRKRANLSLIVPFARPTDLAAESRLA